MKVYQQLVCFAGDNRACSTGYMASGSACTSAVVAKGVQATKYARRASAPNAQQARLCVATPAQVPSAIRSTVAGEFVAVCVHGWCWGLAGKAHGCPGLGRVYTWCRPLYLCSCSMHACSASATNMCKAGACFNVRTGVTCLHKDPQQLAQSWQTHSHCTRALLSTELACDHVASLAF